MVLNPKPFSLILHKYAFKRTDKFMQIQPHCIAPTEHNSSDTPPKPLPLNPCSPARSALAAGPSTCNGCYRASLSCPSPLASHQQPLPHLPSESCHSRLNSGSVYISFLQRDGRAAAGWDTCHFLQAVQQGLFLQSEDTFRILPATPGYISVRSWNWLLYSSP